MPQVELIDAWIFVVAGGNEPDRRFTEGALRALPPRPWLLHGRMAGTASLKFPMNAIQILASLAVALCAVSAVRAEPYVPTYDAEKAWYLGELGVTNLLNAGIIGKGVRVGVIDFGVGDIVTGTHTNVHCAAKAGKSRKGMHGPAVEGIIASDVYGIAPECELYVYDDGDGTVDDLIAGFVWCTSNSCRVINYSGGVHRFSRGVIDLSKEAAAAKLDELRAAVRVALDAGCIVVAAGGNAPNETLTCPQDVRESGT